MPARSDIPPDHQTDQAVAPVVRNLLLYGLLFFQPYTFNVFFASTDPNSSVSEVGNLFNQLVVPAAFFAVCILVYSYSIPARVFWAALIPMAPLLLMTVLSTAWSDFPELTIRRASHEVLEAIALGLLATCFSNPNIVLAIFFRACLIIGCLDLFSSAVLPGAFTDIGFAGIHDNKNTAGQFFFAALPIYLLGTLYREISGNRVLGALGIVSGVAMLVLTESKTSIGTVVFGFSFVLLARGLLSRNLAVRISLALFCFLGLVGAIAVVVNWDYDNLLQMLVGDPTLTGRDQIWAYVESKFHASPIVGVGYGAIWQTGPALLSVFKELRIPFVNEAHEGYLEIAAQLGIAGICCLSIYLTATLFNVTSYWARLEQNKLFGAGALATYIFWGMILYNVTESLYFQAGNGMSCMLIFLGAFVASRNKRSMMMSTAKGTPLNAGGCRTAA
jgi:O-antigen ligase